MARVTDLSGNFPNGVEHKDTPHSRVCVEGSFGATGQSATFEVKGSFNVDINGSTGSTIAIERSFDNGVTWNVLSKDADGGEASYANTDISMALDEVEDGVLYRFNCTAYTGGTPTYRASK